MPSLNIISLLLGMALVFTFGLIHGVGLFTKRFLDLFRLIVEKDSSIAMYLANSHGMQHWNPQFK